MHKAVAAHLLARDQLVLIVHASPDGDTLGSSLALFIALKKLGKQVQIICESPVPALLAFLPQQDQLRRSAQFDGEFAAVAIDCADRERMGTCAEDFDRAAFTINIDHHPTNKQFAQVNYVDTGAAAVGESIWKIICELGSEVDSDVAQCLYAAISTDTGNFCYSNTTPETFRIVSELMKIGFQLNETCSRLFRTRTLSKTRMICICIENLELFFGDQVCVSAISQAEMERICSDETETEGMIDFIRDIETVKVAVFLREVGTDTHKVSLRAKVDIDVSAIAQKFGGGGHVRAAGCTMQGSLATARRQILEALTPHFS